MFLQGGNKIRSTIFTFFFFNYLEKQRLIYIKPHFSLQSLVCHYPYLRMDNCKNQQQIETLVKCNTPSPAALEA